MELGGVPWMCHLATICRGGTSNRGNRGMSLRSSNPTAKVGIPKICIGAIYCMTGGPLRMMKLLGDMKYGPGNRPYWDMKEGRAQLRYPNLIRALAKETDPSRRRQLVESHRL